MGSQLVDEGENSLDYTSQQSQNRRKEPRHHVSWRGQVVVGEAAYDCLLTDCSNHGAGVRIYDLSEVKFPAKGELQVENQLSSAFTTVWQNGAFTGLKLTPPTKDFETKIYKPATTEKLLEHPVKTLLRNDSFRGFEILLVLLTSAATALGVWFAYSELKLQSVLQVEDSEKFINRLLIENKELQPYLLGVPSNNSKTTNSKTDEASSHGKEGALDRTLVGYVLINEFEKQWRIHDMGVTDEQYWCSYLRLVHHNVKNTPIVMELLENHKERLNGFRVDFVDWLLNVQKEKTVEDVLQSDGCTV